VSPSRVTGVIGLLGAAGRAITAVVVGDRFGGGVKVAVAHAIVATSINLRRGRSSPPYIPVLPLQLVHVQRQQ